MFRPILFSFILGFTLLSGCKKPQIVYPVFDLESAYNHADSLFRNRDANDIVLSTYKKIIPNLRQQDDLLRWLISQRRIAIIVGDRQQNRVEALNILKAARDSIWRIPEDDTTNYQLALIHMREARINLEIGDNLQMKECLERTEKVFRKHLYGKYKDIAWYFFSEMANVYTRLGEFENAEQLFRESLRYEQTYKQNGIASHNDYGSTYLSQGKYQSAVHIFEEGLKAPFVDTFTQTLLLLNLAEGLLGLDEVAKAQLANDKTLPLLQNKGSYSPKEYAQCLRGHTENKALIAEKKHLWATAITYYHTAIATENGVDLHRREKAAFIAAEANAYFQLHQYDTALHRYQEAYLQFYPNTMEGKTDLPDAADLLTDKVLADILEGKARCFAQINQDDLALSMYELIPVVESQLRATHTFESSSLLALGKSRRRFDDAVELAWNAWQKTHDEKYAEKAFRFTEMARGVLQNKGIRANDAYAALDEAQKTKDKSLSTRIAAAETELAEMENNDAPKVSMTMQTIRDLKSEQKEFRASLMKTNRAYAAEMSTESTTPLHELGKLLRDGQVVFDYYLIDSLALHVFVADKLGDVSWHRLDWTTTQQQALNSMVNYLGKQPAENEKTDYFAPTAYSLFHSLIEPELNGGKGIPGGLCRGNNYPKTDSALVIIPDMELAGLSFEGLLTDTFAGGKKWGALPYLAKKFSIGYAYSASLLDLQQSITRKHAGIHRMAYAGFAPKYSKMAKLDSAETDVLFGQKLFGGETYTGSTGTEMQLRKISENTQILLMSMHGISDHNEPALSKLYFGNLKDGASNQNNILTAGELQNIPCSADLVILSACDTGDGPMEKGEGVYTLSRAFTISGVPSTIMSFWKLPVVSSSDMVRDFLTGIREHQQKDVALRTAKLKWLEEEALSDLAHPFYWAGFVSTGDTAHLEIDESDKYVYWLVTIGFAVAGGFAWFWKRKK
jgi:hypothetical protein